MALPLSWKVPRPHLRKTIPRPHTDPQRDGQRSGKRSFRRCTFGHFCSVDYPYRLLPHPYIERVEGKYFTPMAKTLVFCIIGALILSLTYVPMMASLFLKHTIVVKPTLADRFFEKLNKIYQHTLRACLHHKWRTVIVAFLRADRFTFSLYPPGSRVHSHFGRR